MTIIGKILTFLVFFMSIVFLGFAVSINQLNKDPKTKLSWVDLAKKRLEYIEQLQKDLAAKDNELGFQKVAIGNLQKEKADILVKVDADLKQARDAENQAKTLATKLQGDFEKSQLAVDAATTELNKRKEEILALIETLKKRETSIADLQVKNNSLTMEKIQAQDAARTFMDRMRGLEKDLRELARERDAERLNIASGAASSTEGQEQVARLLDQAKSLGRDNEQLGVVLERIRSLVVSASAVAGGKRPPPESVQGIVKSVTPDGLVSISIGSDAGLLRGHTLEVFRTEPKPQYLGTVQIIEVSPHEAVGKLMTTQYKKLVQPNDVVASKILPSR